jgi:very-short-patch-repair endonuclease
VLIGCDNEEHGYFLQVPRDHKRGSGCFRCNESRGERFIFNWLRDNDIEFIPQHTFPGLKDKALLRCDFYLPNENIVIEYNGLQHYDAVEVFGGESALKSTRRRDLIKQRFCEHNAIQFEVIRYDESPSVRLLEIILGK